MQHMDSEGKWGDVLLGEYDKQREDEREERMYRCVPKANSGDAHVGVKLPHTDFGNMKQSLPQTKETTDKKIWSFQSWHFFHFSFHFFCLCSAPAPQCLFFHSGASPTVFFPLTHTAHPHSASLPFKTHFKVSSNWHLGCSTHLHPFRSFPQYTSVCAHHQSKGSISIKLHIDKQTQTYFSRAAATSWRPWGLVLFLSQITVLYSQTHKTIQAKLKLMIWDLFFFSFQQTKLISYNFIHLFHSHCFIYPLTFSAYKVKMWMADHKLDTSSVTRQ